MSVHGERVVVPGKAGKHYSVSEMGTMCTGADRCYVAEPCCGTDPYWGSVRVGMPMYPVMVDAFGDRMPVS